MLLLKEDQVQFQDAIDPGSENPKPFLGLFYQNKIFKKLRSFPKERLESVQQLMRQLSINKDVAYLVTERTDKYTIWCEDKKLQAYDRSQSDDWISQIDLKELVREMRDIGGIKIQDRRYRLAVYPRCFIGSEATTWLVRRFFVAEADAVKLGQRLIDTKLLHHVTDSHPFEDGYFFYRFYWDE
jgi:Domain found in Dishevelled, Egl-10, and Pleckstrin (DEP)